MKKSIKSRLLPVLMACVLTFMFVFASSAAEFDLDPEGSLEGNDYNTIIVTGKMLINDPLNYGYASITTFSTTTQNYIYQSVSFKVEYVNYTYSPLQSNYRIGTISAGTSQTVSTGLLNFSSMSLIKAVYTFSVSSDADTYDCVITKWKGVDF